MRAGFGRDRRVLDVDHAVVLVNDDVLSAGCRWVTRVAMFGPRRKLGLGELAERDVKQDVGVVDDEMSLGKQGFGVLGALRRCRAGVSWKERTWFALGRAPEPLADHLRPVVEVDADLASPDRGEASQGDADERPTEKRQQRFRDVGSSPALSRSPRPAAGRNMLSGDLGHGIDAEVKNQESGEIKDATAFTPEDAKDTGNPGRGLL